MNNKIDLKAILTQIKDNNIVMAKDVAAFIKRESRYTQGYLEALEGMGLIKFESKATMKLIILTEKGNDYLKNLN